MNDRDCDNCAHHSDGGCSVWECSFEQKDDTISRQAAIDTEGLDEEIKCEMCRNPMHTVRGCDGNCKYDERLYERIMQILDERIKPLPSAQPTQTDTSNTLKALDCVERQAAIEILYNFAGCIVDTPNGDYRKAYEASRYELETLPSTQPEQRWIPCSERLPEEAYPVIITWKNDDPVSYYQYVLGKHYVGVAHYKNGKWFWYSSITEDVLMEYGRCDSEEFDEAINVLAWMPLPEPYSERRTDERSN